MEQHTIRTPKTMQVTSKGHTLTMTWRPDFGSHYSGCYRAAQRFIDSEVLRRCAPLVPLRYGFLQKSGVLMTDIGTGVVRYGGPHSAPLYYHPEYNFSKEKNAQAGGLWLERMKRAGGTRKILHGARTFMR